MATESFNNPARAFMDSQQIVTGTNRKFGQLKSNLRAVITDIRHKIDWGDTVTEHARQLPISVPERDETIGTDYLIREKASDQIGVLFSALANGDTELSLLSSLPEDLVNIVTDGGVLGTMVTDVAAREQPRHKSIVVADHPWQRVLNFEYSARATHKKHGSVEMMEDELKRFYMNNYRAVGDHPFVRAVDSTIALAIANFHVRTSKQKSNAIIAPPDIKVFPACETAGLLMSRHPLADERLMGEFIGYVINDQEVNRGMSRYDSLLDLGGRAGGSKIEDLFAFCVHKGIECTFLIDQEEGVNELDSMFEIVEGGRWRLLRDLLLTLNTTEGKVSNNGFLVHTYPSQTQYDRMLLEM